MEKTLQFSVVKEKIIKTNELLRVLMEKNKMLEKTQQWTQQLKTKLELSKNEANKLKLKNETVVHELMSTENKYALLNKEHDRLKEDFNQLESESSKTINKLQVNYQLANQELKEWKEKVSQLETEKVPLEENGFLLSDTGKKKSRLKKKVSPVKVKMTPQTVIELKEEKDKLINENSNFKLEIYELKKQIENMQVTEDERALSKKIEDDLKMVQEELRALKKHSKIEMERKDNKIKGFLKKINGVEIEMKKLQAENEKLKEENCSYKVEISMLLETNNGNEKQCRVEEIDVLTNKVGTGENSETSEENVNDLDNINQQVISLSKEKTSKKCNETMKINIGDESSLCNVETLKKCNKAVENDDSNKNQDILLCTVKTPKKTCSTPSDGEISDIMKQMVLPACLSPVKSLLYEGDCSDDENLPFVEGEDTYGNERVSPPTESRSGDKRIISYNNPDLVKSVNRRRNLIRRKRLLAKKRRETPDLFRALVALKKANINFFISTDTIPTTYGVIPQIVNAPYRIHRQWRLNEKEKNNTVTNELKCNLKCCKNSYMLLKDHDDENAPLLGFFDVKNETSARTENRSEDQSDVICLQNCESPQKRKNTENFTTTEKKRQSRQNKDDKNQSIGSDSCEIESPVQVEIENIPGCKINMQKDKIDHSDVTETSKHVANVEPCDKPVKLRRSKRKCNSIMTAIRNKKAAISRKQKMTKPDLSMLDSETSVSDVEENSISSFRTVFGNVTNRSKSICTVAPKTPKNDQKIDPKIQELVQRSVAEEKSSRTSFKRPLCRTRRSLRLVQTPPLVDDSCEKLTADEVQEVASYESPQSPTSICNEPCPASRPVLIPLDQAPEKVEKMPTSKLEMLFNKLIVYSAEEEALNEVVREFSFQDPEYIAEAILERIAVDYHDAPDTKYSPAPLMTDVQRTMLGFMSKLENTNVIGVFDSFLTLAERRLLSCKVLNEIGPITRLYLATCKLEKNLTRMRKLCCDVFYFCGDFAVPFLFIVLTSWTEVLPHELNSNDMPIARVLVQIVYTKDCNKPGYNLLPLRDLLIKFYGYPTERWDVDEFFKELYHEYLRKPVRSSELALLLYCKNRPEKWVHEKIEEYLKPIVNQAPSENFKAAVVILIGNLYNRFSSKSEFNYLPMIREWLTSLLNETAPDVIRRSVYLCLSRLKKK